MDVVIPAAGIGSRFLPVSQIVPKELLPLGTKPLIHHALDEAERAGFNHAVVVLSRAKTAIRSYFDPAPELESVLAARGQERGLRLVHEARAIARRLALTFVEQPGPLGLGDAVLRCRPISGDCFGVLLPDDVVPTAEHWTRLRALHEETGGACLCVRSVPPDQVQRFGIAVCEPVGSTLCVRALQEKPRPFEMASDLAVFGRYVVTAPVLDALAAASRRHSQELQLTSGFAAALRRTPGVFAVRFEAEFFDVGTPEDYAHAAARFVTRSPAPAGAGAGRAAH